MKGTVLAAVAIIVLLEERDGSEQTRRLILKPQRRNKNGDLSFLRTKGSENISSMIRWQRFVTRWDSMKTFILERVAAYNNACVFGRNHVKNQDDWNFKGKSGLA